MLNLLAQRIKISGEEFIGPLPTISLPGGQFKFKFESLADIIFEAQKYLFPIAGLFLFLYLLWGGLTFLLSAGDPKKAEEGKKEITSALIGFLIIFLSYWLVQLLDYLLNLRTLSP